MVGADESSVVDCVPALAASPDLSVPDSASKRARGNRSQGVRKHVATALVLCSISGLLFSVCTCTG